MEYFRFRSMDFLLGSNFQELETQTIHFAKPGELNDPMENFRNVVWIGDKIVWTNLLKHYTFCLLVSYFLYSITRDSDEFDVDEIPIPPRWDLPPNPYIRELFDDMWRRFLNSQNIPEIIETLANTNRKFTYGDLELFLGVLQAVFIRENYELVFQLGIISDSKIHHQINQLPTVKELLEQILIALLQLEDCENEEKFENVAKTIEAMRDVYRLIFLSKYSNVCFPSTRNVLRMILDFPKYYLNEIEELLWPKWYTACFTKNCQNSSLWGHYGDKHRGACLIFESEETDGKNGIKLYCASDDSDKMIPFQEIRYRDKLNEVEFFQSICVLPVNDLMKLWYVDEDDNISEFAPPSDGIDLWLKRYWDCFYRNITSKSKDWEYEQEHRLILHENWSGFSWNGIGERTNRELTYNFNSLKGIIFGIKTSDEEKSRIMDIVLRKCADTKRTEFKFFQAYYSPKDGDISKYEMRVNLAFN